jgi:hypothetical protein
MRDRGKEWVKVGLTQGLDPRSTSEPKPQVKLVPLTIHPPAMPTCRTMSY